MFFFLGGSFIQFLSCQVSAIQPTQKAGHVLMQAAPSSFVAKRNFALGSFADADVHVLERNIRLQQKKRIRTD